MEQWNSHGGTVWWNSVVEQCGGQWNSGTLIVEQCGGTVEQWNSDGGMEWCGGTVWWNNRTVMVEQWDIDGGTV